MTIRCETCKNKIRAGDMRYVNRTNGKTKCLACGMMEANAGQDLTKHPDAHGRKPTNH